MEVEEGTRGRAGGGDSRGVGEVLPRGDPSWHWKLNRSRHTTKEIFSSYFPLSQMCGGWLHGTGRETVRVNEREREWNERV